jgi:biopolymer transport protein ExbB/TolQ
MLLVIFAFTAVAQAQPAEEPESPDSMAADTAATDSVAAEDTTEVAEEPEPEPEPEPEDTLAAESDTTAAAIEESGGLFSSIAEFFRKGGPAMWVILVILAAGLAIFVERFIFLFIIANIKPEEFMARISELIRKGSIEGAIAEASERDAPLARIIEAALRNYRGTERDIQNAVDEMALAELPRLNARTSYLAMFANISTMVGLLGTIFGLIQAFAAVAAADPETKSTLLANGISQAMNTTAFGLIGAIPQLIAHSFLTAKTDRLVDDIDRYSVMVINMLGQARKEG